MHRALLFLGWLSDLFRIPSPSQGTRVQVSLGAHLRTANHIQGFPAGRTRRTRVQAGWGDNPSRENVKELGVGSIDLTRLFKTGKGPYAKILAGRNLASRQLSG